MREAWPRMSGGLPVDEATRELIDQQFGSVPVFGENSCAG
jgi:hypothetical protein